VNEPDSILKAALETSFREQGNHFLVEVDLTFAQELLGVVFASCKRHKIKSRQSCLFPIAHKYDGTCFWSSIFDGLVSVLEMLLDGVVGRFGHGK